MPAEPHSLGGDNQCQSTEQRDTESERENVKHRISLDRRVCEYMTENLNKEVSDT